MRLKLKNYIIFVLFCFLAFSCGFIPSGECRALAKTSGPEQSGLKAEHQRLIRNPGAKAEADSSFSHARAESSSSYARQLQEAITSYRRSSLFYETQIKKHPGDVQLRLSLADFYYHFRDYNRTVSLLKGLPAVAQNDLRARMLLAKAYTRLKKYNYALAIFDHTTVPAARGEKILPQAEYFYLYGTVLEHKNIFTRALKQYQKVSGPLSKLAQVRVAAIKSHQGVSALAYIEIGRAHV